MNEEWVFVETVYYGHYAIPYDVYRNIKTNELKMFRG